MERPVWRKLDGCFGAVANSAWVGGGPPGFAEPAVQIIIVRFTGIKDANGRWTTGS